MVLFFGLFRGINLYSKMAMYIVSIEYIRDLSIKCQEWSNKVKMDWSCKQPMEVGEQLNRSSIKDAQLFVVQLLMLRGEVNVWGEFTLDLYPPKEVGTANQGMTDDPHEALLPHIALNQI